MKINAKVILAILPVALIAPLGADPPKALSSPAAADLVRETQQAWAESLNRRIEFTNRIGMRFRLIPPGRFEMGSARSPEEIAKLFNQAVEAYDFARPQHPVTISSPFYLQATEVTQGQWEDVMGTTPWNGQDQARVGDDLPASFVSWNDAAEFCRRLSLRDGRSYRLPTEAEWEFACRAGTTTLYHFGDDISQLGQYAWIAENTWLGEAGYPHPVGTRLPNALGLDDMHGNIREWCRDWFGVYTDEPATDPTGPDDGEFRVHRGGTWVHHHSAATSANRYGDLPSTTGPEYGFRVVLAIDGAGPRQ